MLSCQFFGNLQSPPGGHNLAAFSNASAILPSTCGIISGTVYKYTHTYFLLEVSDSDCTLSSPVFCTDILLARHWRGNSRFWWEFMSYYLSCGLTVAQIQFPWFYTFEKHQLKCWTARKVPSSSQPSFQGCRELQEFVCATRSLLWLDWNSPGCSSRAQVEQCSCGALVKGMVILAKYWLCLSAFWLGGLSMCAHKGRTASSSTDGRLRVSTQQPAMQHSRSHAGSDTGKSVPLRSSIQHKDQSASQQVCFHKQTFQKLFDLHCSMFWSGDKPGNVASSPACSWRNDRSSSNKLHNTVLSLKYMYIY